ncbi:fibronectin type III domain-containing protein [Streptomyces sp. NPDC051907]|uniref:fibronectin type III domain-containing protein n=1 Tax=Streptomyces sp. NPDC051907 TaxID=3155284 RepID=UPI003429B691
MADTGGINITVTPETASQVAQRLVCWDRESGVRMQSIEYRTDGNRPYFRVPAGICVDRGALALTPGGTAVTCPASGTPTQITPTLAEVGGVNANSCTEIPVPTSLAVSGTPTTTVIAVQWAAPATGATPTGYRLAYRADGSSGAWSYKDVGAGVLTTSVTGLTVNTAYDFKVQAKQGTYWSPYTSDVTISTAAS